MAEEVHDQIPIGADHSKLVKFKSRDDENYLHVRSKMKTAFGKAPEVLRQHLDTASSGLVVRLGLTDIAQIHRGGNSY
jgi:hypothetical protein